MKYFYIISFAIAAAFGVYYLNQWDKCTQAHGIYVRTLFGMECITGAPKEAKTVEI